MRNMKDKILEKQDNGHIPKHHAYAIYSSFPEQIAQDIESERTFPSVIFNRYYESLKLKDIQDFLQFIQEKKASNEDDYILVAFQNIGEEVQNALLKVIEEIGEGKHIVFIYPRSLNILNTFKSRLLPIEMDGLEIAGEQSEEFLSVPIDDFLGASLDEKFSLIQKFLMSEKKREDREKRIHSKTYQYIETLERKISQMIKEEGNIKKKMKLSSLVESIIETKTFLEKRGSSPKNLLESLSIELSFLYQKN